MYAVIEAGGKQHRVVEGETLKLGKIEVATGETVEFDKVLMVGGDDVKIGTPVVEGAKVTVGVVPGMIADEPAVLARLTFVLDIPIPKTKVMRKRASMCFAAFPNSPFFR